MNKQIHAFIHSAMLAPITDQNRPTSTSSARHLADLHLRSGSGYSPYTIQKSNSDGHSIGKRRALWRRLQSEQARDSAS